MILIPIGFSILYVLAIAGALIILSGKEPEAKPYTAQDWFQGIFMSAVSVGLWRILEGKWGPVSVTMMMWSLFTAGLMVKRIGKYRAIGSAMAGTVVITSSLGIFLAWHLYLAR